MLRLRMCALLLVALTLVAAVWAFVAYETLEVAGALLVGAASLAVVAPFDAAAPRRRWRVLLACLVYVALLAVAIWMAHSLAAAGLLTGVLALLAQAGIALALWAFATRKRRRTPSYQRYYDN